MLGLRRNQSGDTLIEVMLAITIMGVVITGSYALSSRALRLNQASKERTQAVAYLQQQAEIIQAKATHDWAELSLDVENPTTRSDAYFTSSNNWVNPCKPTDLNGDTFNDRTGICAPVSPRYDVRYDADCRPTCNPGLGDEIDQIQFTITARWEPVSSPEVESSRVVMKVNRP